MPNYYLSVLYKHIIQVQNKNVGLKVGGGHKHTIAPPQSKKWGGHMPPLPPPPPPPRFLRQCINMISLSLSLSLSLWLKIFPTPI